MTTSGTHTIDVGQVLDDGHWSNRQKLFVLLTALTIVFDGIDNQLLGIAVPAMMRDWAVPRGAFRPVVAAGMVGMMIGGALAGLVGDRMGRRFALIGSVLIFGVLTAAVRARRQPLGARRPALPCRPGSRRGDAQRGRTRIRVRAPPAPAVRHHLDHRLRPTRRHARRARRRIRHAGVRLAHPLCPGRCAAASRRGRARALPAGISPLPGAPSAALGRARAHPRADRPRRPRRHQVRRSRRESRRSRVSRRALHTRFPPRHRRPLGRDVRVHARRLHRLQLGAVDARRRRSRPDGREQRYRRLQSRRRRRRDLRRHRDRAHRFAANHAVDRRHRRRRRRHPRA